MTRTTGYQRALERKKESRSRRWKKYIRGIWNIKIKKGKTSNRSRIYPQVTVAWDNIPIVFLVNRKSGCAVKKKKKKSKLISAAGCGISYLFVSVKAVSERA